MRNIFLILAIVNLIIAILYTIQGNNQISGIGGWICVILLNEIQRRMK